jgi:hypothetical protein
MNTINRDALQYAIRRAQAQVDQWDHVENGQGPDLDCLSERAETLIDIMRDVASLRLLEPDYAGGLRCMLSARSQIAQAYRMLSELKGTLNKLDCSLDLVLDRLDDVQTILEDATQE